MTIGNTCGNHCQIGDIVPFLGDKDVPPADNRALNPTAGLDHDECVIGSSLDHGHERIACLSNLALAPAPSH